MRAPAAVEGAVAVGAGEAATSRALAADAGGAGPSDVGMAAAAGAEAESTRASPLASQIPGFAAQPLLNAAVPAL